MVKKFSKNDEGFVCVNCGKEVLPLKVTSRDHCPYCLTSLHVDVFPGDRANDCKGVLQPIGLEISGKKGKVIVYRCQKCHQIHKNKVAIDDSEKSLLKL